MVYSHIAWNCSQNNKKVCKQLSDCCKRFLWYLFVLVNLYFEWRCLLSVLNLIRKLCCLVWMISDCNDPDKILALAYFMKICLQWILLYWCNSVNEKSGWSLYLKMRLKMLNLVACLTFAQSSVKRDTKPAPLKCIIKLAWLLLKQDRGKSSILTLFFEFLD